MSTKEIPEPRPGPEFNGDPAEYARQMALYLQEHLRDIHREIERLHDEKADA